ncbi:MAG: protein kinase [Sandaracinaceae bacterium]|nr:protein kinase [Sandaracinaceae bacterium]
MGREDETLIAPPAGSIGPYAVERILGQGGMGVVVAARGPDGARVAIKSMRAGVGARSMRERFAREAMVRIDHPNVIRSLGAGLAADGAPYIVFELLEGESLAQRLEAEPRLPVADVLSILDQACAGLEAAHAAGIVHRDLKPANVYLCADGTVKLLDFGIALVRGETRLTADASVLGTAAYLAPEQARGQRDLDERADVWALGVIAYEALSGRLPFDAASALATMLAIIQNDPPPLETLARHVPPELARVVERCLRKHRDERFPSATALRGALAGIDPASGARVRRESLPPAAARGLSTLRTDESRLVVVLLARDALDAAAIESEVRAQGGEAVALHGSHVVGLFGSERWRGDEARRAIGAAIAIRHLASRVAVASGRATAAGASGILGDGLSRAERACEHPLDGVAVVPDAAAAAGDVFLHGEATDDVVEVIGTRDDGADAHDDAHLPTLVGRQSELALLAEAVERGGIVCVSGPPGIGKTRLRHEILRMLEQRSVPPALVLSASGEPLERDRAFGLVAAALRRHARERASTRRWPPLRPEAPPLVQRQAVLALAREAIDDREAAQRCADGLALVIGIASDARRSHAQHDPQLVRDRMRLALLDYFAAWSTKGAAAIAFEDVQWADPETLALADELTVIHPEAFVLLTARSAAVFAPLQRAAERAVRIELGGLDVAGVQAIADGAAGRPLPDALLRALAERSEGNPLFVEHMASALRLKADLDAERLPLPFTVEAAIQARLDELAHDEREACKLASVVGRPFEADDLAALGAARPRRCWPPSRPRA